MPVARTAWPRSAFCTLLFLAVSVIGLGATPGVAQTNSAPPEIVELARALKSNPDLIYEYVYNNIETLPQYGSAKGVLGTLLDGKGTAFDQAELMVALLQQSGYSASYQFGQIQLSADQLSSWLGVDNSLNSVGFTIGSGGFPATTFNDPVTFVQLGWAWVVVNIGGTNYVFDPSTKNYSRSAGLGPSGVAAALGYNQSSFINDAESGATITPTAVSGLNRTNIRSDLIAYSNNLVRYIRSNSPAATPAGIVGGKIIVPLLPGTQLRQTSLSYAVAGTVTPAPTMPDIYRTTLTLTLGSDDASNNFTAVSSPITFNSSDIYDHRLVVSFDASAVPSLLLDGVPQLVASGAVPSGRQLTVRASIFHPYPTTFVNVTDSDAVRMTPFTSFIYLLGTGWGQTGQGSIEKHRRLLQDNMAANPGNPAAEAVLGESFAMIGYTWLAECSQQQQLVDQLIGTTTVYHHALGVVGTKSLGPSSSGPYVDLPINGFSVVQRSARASSLPSSTPIEASAFFSSGIFSSIAESGTLEQTQPGATAASTVKLVDTAVAAGGTIYDINNSAVPGDTPAYYTSTIRPVLASTYGSSDLARIDSLVNQQNLRVIAPAAGNITINLYTGAGYFQIAQDGSTIGSIITGGLSGGEPTSNVPTEQIPDNTQQSNQPSPTQTITNSSIGSQGNGGGLQGVTQTSNEPINLVTGDYLNFVTDLTVGSQAMPYGLAFERYYDSGTRATKGIVGGGWTHNFAVTAAIDSDSFAGLAANSPISGASAIAATFVMLDILNGETTVANPLDRVVVASVAQRWLMDQLIGNTVAVSQPGYVEHFTKLADGSYNAPPGSATVLSLDAGTFRYVASNQQAMNFDSAGNLQSSTTPSGATITLNYSGSPEVLTSVSNNLGRTLSLSYTSGLLTSVSDGTGRSVSYGYDATDNMTGCTDPSGKVTTYIYDLPGRLTQIFYPANPMLPFVTNTYDSVGRVQTQAGGANPPWQYFFAGARSEEDDPFGTQHVIYTTPHGKTRVEIQDLQDLNLVTTNSYDGLDRLTKTVSPEGKAASYSYDINSNVLSSTITPKPGSPLSPSTTSFTYDGVYNKPTIMTDPLGLVTSMSYDSLGNLATSISDVGSSPHLNARTTYNYNTVGQVVYKTDPLGVFTQYVYGNNGNLTSAIRDAGIGRLNQQTVFGYSPQGDVILTADPKGNVTTSSFDTNRRLISTTAANGLVTAYIYDANGQLLQAQQLSNGNVLRRTSATYTLTGKAATTTDANNNTATFAYDALDRVLKTTDPMQRVTGYGYDALSRKISVSNPAIRAAPLLQQSYTPDGLLASLKDANSNTTNFAYDGLDRLTTTTYPLGSSEALTYDADSNVLTRKTRAGQTITFTYDTLNRLRTKTPPSPAAVVSYRYDLAGHLTGVSDTSAAIVTAVPPSGSSIQYAANYSYDVVNRPTGVNWTPAPAPAAPIASSVTFTHSYNAANQRTGQSISDNSWVNYPAATASQVSYAANALNQYTAVGSVSPTYDGNGNLTSDGTFTLDYDAESRLISASGAGNTATYSFDAQGRRKTKSVNGGTTVFVTDADNREVLEYDGASGAIQNWYAYALGPNDVLNQTNVATGTRAALIPDIQGSIIVSQDSSSGVLTKVGYLPYGAGASGGPFGFTGQRIDLETSGLYYYRARHYSAAWGRFLQVDPIGQGGGINLYAYVNNDPLNLIDPMGLMDSPPASSASTIALPAVGAAGGAAGAAVAVGTLGAGAVACVLLCATQMGSDLPMVSNEQAQSGITPNQQSITHGNSLDSQRQTYVYQLTEVTTGEVLKYGITSEPNPTSRYPVTFYADTNSRMDVIAAYSNRGFARAHEIVASGLYVINNGQLPRLSSVP